MLPNYSCNHEILLKRKEEGKNMHKCIECGKLIGKYRHFNGGYVCEQCLGDYFTCPKCGMVYDIDDYDNGDGGDGNCVKCNKER